MCYQVQAPQDEILNNPLRQSLIGLTDCPAINILCQQHLSANSSLRAAVLQAHHRATHERLKPSLPPVRSTNEVVFAKYLNGAVNRQGFDRMAAPAYGCGAKERIDDGFFAGLDDRFKERRER